MVETLFLLIIFQGLHMRCRLRIRPYNQGSKSAKVLASYLGAKVLKLENSRFIPRRRDIVINWGNSRTYQGDCIVINQPCFVSNASNKLRTFNILDEAGISIPSYTTDKQYAFERYSRVFVRQTVTGHSGEGIVVVDTEDVEELPNAPLYVEGIVKKNEYRVIVVGNEVVDIKQKRLSSEAPEERSRFVRNLSNGWIYARENLEYIEGLREIAIEAVRALSLDFGAVDIISTRDNTLFVLEVNTAFGLDGSTIELVGEAIKRQWLS